MIACRAGRRGQFQHSVEKLLWARDDGLLDHRAHNCCSQLFPCDLSREFLALRRNSCEADGLASISRVGLGGHACKQTPRGVHLLRLLLLQRFSRSARMSRSHVAKRSHSAHFHESATGELVPSRSLGPLQGRGKAWGLCSGNRIGM